jgi:plastocyanin
MTFDVHAMTPEDFDAWLAANIEAANATPAPTEPPPSGEPAPSGEAGQGPTLNVSALNIAFEQTTLEVPADTPFKIAFENKDAGVPHNVEIKDAAGTSLFQGEIFNGVETRTYDVPALAAGSYPFFCTVHPNMTGTITAN